MDIDSGNLVFQLKDKNLFKQQCFINGKWEDADNNATFDVINPSDSSLIGTMPNSTKKETKKAVNAAKTAWKEWKNLTGKDRSLIILNAIASFILITGITNTLVGKL